MDSNNNTPAIVILTIGDSISAWNDVLLGIEEEGIPFVIQPQTDSDVTRCAWKAARQSPLLVGIACDKEKLVVHYKNLPASAPLFTLTYRQNSLDRRSTGNNAARLVKGISFRDLNS
ncbi:propanediol dehydratase [Citrobacter amalonaticus]|uniref:Propanediol dehydratase n=1 Tax=Citrobacter amalonaticus TaxID=35703 RepID=A0A2S4S2Q6_CITAM|nr:glycerol dehydratase reactivase beta/small subunit family protein [Citrobacter amalonaticus]POT59547.1 propanediol dehydratase [Citrobacter amalonaticus]POT77677.1 propanediol dehydratase [Citrobacter amalonaticus]POU68129.1 propanediol dehydratase [Citrobacter amalonaticus]POV07733.1 propanediol dehydratase [Citrobacter amalonaticus]